MLEVSTQDIKSLRESSGAGVMDCKKALIEAQGDLGRAEEILKKQGLAKAVKKAGRATEQGIVEAYVHGGGRIGAMVEVNCETDFVARTEEFKELAHNIAMQVAAMTPLYIDPSELSQETELNSEEAALLQQPYIKDPSKTVKDIITETVAKVGENITVRRFSRFELGKG